MIDYAHTYFDPATEQHGRVLICNPDDPDTRLAQEGDIIITRDDAGWWIVFVGTGGERSSPPGPEGDSPAGPLCSLIAGGGLIIHPRAADADEITRAGFRIEGDRARHAATLARYPLDAFMVHASITDKYKMRRFGQFLVLEDGLPALDRVYFDLLASDTTAAGKENA